MTTTEPDRPRLATGLEALLDELTALRAEMVAAADHATFDDLHPTHRASARNLIHYLALRRRDLRPLQQRLTELGLSSLGRAESHVLANVDAVLDVLRRLAQRTDAARAGALVDFNE